MKEEIVNLYNQAEIKLHFAAEEQMKPEEDLVHYSVCHNSRTSIRLYLTSYLLNHDKQVEANSSIMDLIKQCAEIDSRFADINLSEIECRDTKASKNYEYCLSTNKVGGCFAAAKEVRDLVKEVSSK